MSQDYAPRKRDWHEIAAEAAKETDPKRRMQLADELERALDERDKRLGKKVGRIWQQIRKSA